ncbi:MAG: RNA polymerase sigma factor [Candidatus Omnitrophica bacterium]|nr:RNA polymerase sigma factor [Candidatus Omnitrophota bacterium]
MQDISDKILVQAAAGDMDSFHEIYKATSCFVYNVAHRITNSREDAEDVTQEVFLKIHKNLNNFQFRSSFKTWVYRITVNTAINATKKTSKDLNRRVDFDKAIQSLGDAPKESGVDKEANELKVKALLDKLNPDQRACVVLREIEGLSYEEIAKSLKINLNTVRSRLKRARAMLMNIGQKRGDLK